MNASSVCSSVCFAVSKSAMGNVCFVPPAAVTIANSLAHMVLSTYIMRVATTREQGTVEGGVTVLMRVEGAFTGQSLLLFASLSP